VGGGLLAAGHRSGTRLLQALERGGCTHVVTILSEKEGALDLRAACLQHHLGWIWIPLGSARPPGRRQTQEIRETFVRMRELLGSSAKVYVHCSGGIHRTGMIVHGFLRFMGFSQAEAQCALGVLRKEVATGVKPEHLEWGEQFAETRFDA
jgi:protein-tyrosine phosphatase